VAENVVLGLEPRRFGLLDRKAMVRSVNAVARTYGFTVDPEALVEQIGVGGQQRVEILKTLYRGADLLILDEPTANLTPEEALELERVVRSLASAGRTVVFISHKLREVLRIAHRVGVLRHGRLVWLGAPGEITESELSLRMVGSRISAIERNDQPRGTEARHHVTEPCHPVLQAIDLHAQNDRGRPALRGVSFDLFPGEILAIAGVDGNGQAELAELLSGLRAPTSGRVLMAGADLSGQPPRRFRDAGIGHVPADRQKRGLCLSLRVDENISLGRQQRAPFARGFLVDRAGRREAARKLLADWDVQPPDPALPARALSGGNQQKVILGREIDTAFRVLVVVQPTRGLDVGAIERVFGRLRAERDRGAAVLLVSLDLDEVLALADRILVLFGGRVMGVVAGAGADEKVLGRMMMGRMTETDA
jgi:general nucleoside transport system ATP-binding protein